MRGPEMSTASPLRKSESPSDGLYEAEQVAVVSVRRLDCARVTESELLVGRLSFASRLPQYLGTRCAHQRGNHEWNKSCRVAVTYLTTAMLTGAVVDARHI